VYEILEPGCISNELLQRSDVILNINHSNKVTDVLGRCNNGKGTLDLALRENFIEAECDLPKTNTANDTLELIKRGDISGMSFAFEDDLEDTENGVSYERTDEVEDGKEVWLRHVKRITGLYDVSIVTHPAYEQTSVGTREAGNEIDKAIDRQIEADNKQRDVEDPIKDEEAEREERELEEQAERARVMMMQRLRWQRRHNEEYFK
jgi:HK97 family phage prohead protease